MSLINDKLYKLATPVMGLLLVALICGPKQAFGASVRVTFDGIEDISGNLMVSLFDKAEPFPNDFEKAVANARQPIDAETMTILFEDVAPGDYSVSAYQDVNANGELDRGLFNAPTEPYGFSNNARSAFGPPAFDKTLFTVSEGRTQINITLE